MKYPLSDIESISQQTLTAFSRVNIHDTDMFLINASTPSLRKKLSNETGIDISEITKISSMSDLYALKELD